MVKFCLQAFLKDKFITASVYELVNDRADQIRFHPRDLLDFVVANCIHGSRGNPFIPCCKWENWKSKFATKRCVFVYTQSSNLLRLACQPSELRSTLLIRSLVEDVSPSEYEVFGDQRYLQNGTVLCFKVPSDLQNDKQQCDLKFLIRSFNDESDLAYGSILIARDHDNSSNNNVAVVVVEEAGADEADDKDPALKSYVAQSSYAIVEEAVVDKANEDDPLFVPVPQIATPYIKTKAWNIHMINTDQREDLEQKVGFLGGTVTKNFVEAQYYIVAGSIDTFEKLEQAVTFADDMSIREFIKKNSIRLLRPVWLHHCFERSSFFDPGSKYDHSMQPCSPQNADPSGRTPMNFSSPPPALLAASNDAISNNTSRRQLFSIDDTADAMKNRRKSAPITMENRSSVTESESADDARQLLSLIKISNEQNQRKQEELEFTLEQTEAQLKHNQEWLKEALEANEELSAFAPIAQGYELYDSQQQLPNTFSGDLGDDDDGNDDDTQVD